MGFIKIMCGYSGHKKSCVSNTAFFVLWLLDFVQSANLLTFYTLAYKPTLFESALSKCHLSLDICCNQIITS